MIRTQEEKEMRKNKILCCIISLLLLYFCTPVNIHLLTSTIKDVLRAMLIFEVSNEYEVDGGRFSIIFGWLIDLVK